MRMNTLHAPVNAALLGVAARSQLTWTQADALGIIREGRRPHPSTFPVSNPLTREPLECDRSPDHIADFPVDWYDPRDLVVPERFDFGAKNIYARLREKSVECDWGRMVYLFHLAIWNQFFERVPRKASEADFLNSFHQILDATRMAPGRGLYSLIPLARNGAPVNGAHRIVSALQLDKSVACVKTEISPESCNYNYRFFVDQFRDAGQLPHLKSLASDVFDAMALDICRLLPNIAIAVKYPAARGHNDEVDRILSEHASIFYKKAVTFRNDGPTELIRTVYEGARWLGTHKCDFEGARDKAASCFAHRGPAYFYLLAFEDPADLVRAKERVRHLFRISHHSMHITDTRGEALCLAKLAFSNNSIRFANLRSQKEMRNFERLFSIYRAALSSVDDADDFCIDGSAVMSAYGIRDCRDLDFICHGGQSILQLSDSLIASHNGYARYYAPKTLDDIIYDHRNHFWVSGVKFATLANVRAWKAARGEPKDHEDVALINAGCATGPLNVVLTNCRLAAKRFQRSFRSRVRAMLLSRAGRPLNWLRKRITRAMREGGK